MAQLLVVHTPARFIQLPDVISPFFTEIILFLVAAFSFIFLITLLGLGTKNLLGKLLVKFGEKTISKIPLANAIFTTTKEISKIVFSEGEKLIPVKACGLSLMSMGFVAGRDAPVMWRGPLLAQALSQFLEQVAWGELDILLVDLPPVTGDIPCVNRLRCLVR